MCVNVVKMLVNSNNIIIVKRGNKVNENWFLLKSSLCLDSKFKCWYDKAGDILQRSKTELAKLNYL